MSTKHINIEEERKRLYFEIDNAEKDDLAKIKIKLDILDSLEKSGAQQNEKVEFVVTSKPYPKQQE